MKKNNLKLGSLLTAIVLGVLIGVYLNLFIPKLFMFSNVLIMLFSISIFFYFAYKRPVFIELFAYAISIYVIFQYTWDYAVGDRGIARMMLFINALTLLLINIFTGHVRLIGAKSTAKRAIGLG